MIGDNLETDIRGANSVKFSSLLLGTGVHKITDKSGCDLDLNAIQSCQNKLSSFADYAMTRLRRPTVKALRRTIAALTLNKEWRIPSPYYFEY